MADRRHQVGVQHARGEQHERALPVEVEPLGRALGEHDGGEGAEPLALLDLVIDPVADARIARIGEDRPVAQRAGTELRASLAPADDLARGKGCRDRIEIERFSHGRRIVAAAEIDDLLRFVVHPLLVHHRVRDEQAGADRRAVVAAGRKQARALERRAFQDRGIGVAIVERAAAETEIAVRRRLAVLR